MVFTSRSITATDMLATIIKILQFRKPYMDVLLFLLLSLAFIFIYVGHKNTAITLFATTMLVYMYWFSYHATDTLNINL